MGNRWGRWGLLLVMVAGIWGCQNTFKGAGKDTEQIGQKMEGKPKSPNLEPE